MRLVPAVGIGVVALGLSAAGPAAGAGGPMPPEQGGAGAGAPGGDVTYVAVGAGAGRTVVQRIHRPDGAVERFRLLRGDFGVGAIAFDGSTTGLSADGRTLVLAGIVRSWPPRSTRLVVLDPAGLRERRRITLPGYFTLDAISPDGRRLYLIHYPSANDALRYEVRAYDLRARRLLARPVVDPREPDEKMQGIAVTRTVGADGRWAYTLYQRPGAAPFVHALDTQAGSARCVDLPAGLTDTDLSGLRLRLDGGGTALRLVGAAGTLATVDTHTWAVRGPAARALTAAHPAPRAGPGTDQAGGSWPWALTAVPLLGFAGLFVAQRRRHRSGARGDRHIA